MNFFLSQDYAFVKWNNSTKPFFIKAFCVQSETKTINAVVPILPTVYLLFIPNLTNEYSCFFCAKHMDC